jgi:hypothetical protein
MFSASFPWSISFAWLSTSSDSCLWFIFGAGPVIFYFLIVFEFLNCPISILFYFEIEVFVLALLLQDDLYLQALLLL